MRPREDLITRMREIMKNWGQNRLFSAFTIDMVRKSSFFPKLGPSIVPKNFNHSGTKPKKLIKIYIAKISVPSSNLKIVHFTLYFYKEIIPKIRGQNGIFSAFMIDMVRKSSFFGVLIFHPSR